MKASDLLVNCLELEGVEYVFGVPGEENADFVMSLKHSDRIHFVLTRHEQGAAFMAEEFQRENEQKVGRKYAELLAPVEIHFETHVEFKRRVPLAVGLIRTGDTTQYGNIILESA